MTAGMPHGRRVALGLVTAWPLVWFFAITPAVLLFSVSQPDDRYKDEIITAFLLLVVGHVVTAGLVVCLFVAYCVHVWRNARLDGEKRWLWLALIVAANVLAMPVYWWAHVWRDPVPESAGVPPPPPARG